MKKIEIIAVKSGKGGCDKTTATINIASADAEIYGQKVLVIDTDGRGHTTSMFSDNADDLYQIGDILLDKVKPADAIFKTKWSNIDCIGCGEEIKDDLKALEKEIFMDPMHRLGKILEEISAMERYDRCYIDCNQDPDLMAVNILLIADRVLIPARSDDYSLDGVAKMLEWMSQIKGSREKLLNYNVMITDKERNKESDESVSKIRDLVGDHLCETYIRHQAKVVQHSSKQHVKVPFVLERRLAGIAEDYIALVKELFDYEK